MSKERNRVRKNLIHYYITENNVCYLLIIITVLSALKTIRFTGLWAATHYSFNYEAGFIKRGFVGTFFSTILGDWYFNYNVIFFITLLIMFLSIVLLLYVFRKTILEDKSMLFIAIIFLTSPAFVYYVHIIGYFEQLGFLAILVMYILLQRIDYRVFFPLMVLLFIVLIFIHEVLLIIYGVPAFLLLLLSIKNRYGKDILTIKTMFLTFLAIVIPAMLSLLIILNYGTIDKHTEKNLFDQLNKKTDFELRRDATDVLGRTFIQNMIITNFRKDKYYYQEMIFSIIISFPVLIILIIYGIKTILVSKQINRFIFILLFIIGSISPLMIHYIAWDIQRWNSICVFSSLLSLIIIREIISFDTDSFKSNIWFSLKFLMIILLISAISNNYFFDEKEITLFPFVDHVFYFIDLFFGNAKFPTMPPM